ncbi:MAG: protein kinase [Thermomicrobia bacterium]|nr:protein kinase [Thermomicrobia bacterium]
MEDRTGHWLAGRYRLDRRLATETTGDRYEAWDGEALLCVVVHLFAPTMLASPDDLTRFERQVTRLRTLDHPGTVAVRGIARDGETHFLVLDTPPGPSLTTVLREREQPFTPAEAARLLRPVADALDALHAVGLVHRQITPETITVGPNGSGMLAPPAFVPPGMDAGLIAPSPFLSPEQAAGDPVTGASDIYAFGAVLNDMLAEACVFVGEEANQPLIAPAMHAPSLPNQANWAILSALNPNPAARPPRASLLIAAIGGVERDEGQETAAIGRGGDDQTRAVPLPLDDRDPTGLFTAPVMPEPDAARRRRSPMLFILTLFTLLVVAGAVVLGALVVRRNTTLAAQQGHYTAAEPIPMGSARWHKEIIQPPLPPSRGPVTTKTHRRRQRGHSRSSERSDSIR